MWKPAAAVIILTMAGATALAQQQQSPIETLDKTISELAQEGYEIKAAEDLSGDIPKLILQKAGSIVICQINFSDGEEHCFQLRSRGGEIRAARIWDFGAPLWITKRCHLLDDARSLLPCVALYPTAATRSSGSSPWARFQ